MNKVNARRVMTIAGIRKKRTTFPARVSANES